MNFIYHFIDKCIKSFYINEIYIIPENVIKTVSIDLFEDCGIKLFKIKNFNGRLIVKYYYEGILPIYILKFISENDDNSILNFRYKKNDEIDIESISEDSWKILGGNFNNYTFE